jgi:hypothetical protein
MCGRGGGSRKLCGEQCLRRAGFFFARGGPVGGRNQHRESADLRVRPLGRQPKTPVPTGSPTTWIGNPNVHPSKDIVRKEPEKGWRGGGPPCPLRWASHREYAIERAAQQLGSEIAVPRTENRRCIRTDRLLYFLLLNSLGLPPCGPPCLLRWASHQKYPSQRAAQPAGSAIAVPGT